MKIHLSGIGGVGMAGLAVLLKRRGHIVNGCDLQMGARTRWLEEQGIPVVQNHDPSHVEGVDELIVTPALAPDNPELLAARDRGVGFVETRGRALAALVSAADDSIAVCGSHGKTTTATFLAKLLLALGEDVEWAIGGETGDFPVAGCRGSAPVLIVEADESDGTLADYSAKTLVVTNCDYDHPDHFKTRADYVACYDAARARAGVVIEGESLPPLKDVVCLEDLAPHNQKNARAAIEVALRRGHALEAILKVLPSIVAVRPDRRFQRIAPLANPAQSSQPLVYTDYAHHPTEMACAIQMARQIAKGRVIVLFQPHRYSRTKALAHEFPAAFTGADEVVLCPTYAAFEQPVEGGDSADLYAACRSVFALKTGSPRLFLARTIQEAWVHARNTMQTGDVTLLLGAGDIIDLVPQIQADFVSLVCAARRPPPVRFWIGQGSNTWKSDLELDVEYVKTTGPAGRPGATLLADPEISPRIPWMAGIPGTIGGWIKMNAGAFGHSISEIIEAVQVDGRWIAAADCDFRYRQSGIVGEIQDFRPTPPPAGSSAPSASPSDYLARRKKFPAGTKGSVFKNPPNDFAGRLLEAAGVKGLRVGGAFVWSEHANVIVAGADATASDFLALARLMAARVRFRFGISLESEVIGLWV